MNAQRILRKVLVLGALSLFVVALGVFATYAGTESPVNIYQATLMEANKKTPEISTDEVRRVLAEKGVTVFDTRSFKEYAIDHIPGAVNASDVARIGRIVKGNKTAPIVLYCNGPFCGKSKRLAKKLLAAGYTNVRLYQLGIPVWRALGGITEIELEGVRYVVEKDQTAVLLDTREPEEFKAATIQSARNLPFSGVKLGKDVGEVKKAKKDGRLPVKDHNTRIIVFGTSEGQAKAVADALAKEAFHNVSYFAGTFETLRAAIK